MNLYFSAATSPRSSCAPHQGSLFYDLYLEILQQHFLPTVLIRILFLLGVIRTFWKLNPLSTTAFWRGARRYNSASRVHWGTRSWYDPTTGSNLHTFPGGVWQFYNCSNWAHDILHSFPRVKCQICLRNNKIFMFLCPVILKFCGPSATKIITFLICICGQNGNLTNLQKCKIIGNRASRPPNTA